METCLSGLLVSKGHHQHTQLRLEKLTHCLPSGCELQTVNGGDYFSISHWVPSPFTPNQAKTFPVIHRDGTERPAWRPTWELKGQHPSKRLLQNSKRNLPVWHHSKNVASEESSRFKVGGSMLAREMLWTAVWLKMVRVFHIWENSSSSEVNTHLITHTYTTPLSHPLSYKYGNWGLEKLSHLHNSQGFKLVGPTPLNTAMLSHQAASTESGRPW